MFWHFLKMIVSPCYESPKEEKDFDQVSIYSVTANFLFPNELIPLPPGSGIGTEEEQDYNDFQADMR